MSAAILLLAARVLTLDQAVDTARAHQPQARQAHAGTLAAEARADEARAPLLPQLTGTGQYQRRTGNFAAPPGSLPSTVAGGGTVPMTMRDPWATFNYWNFGLVLSQTVWDWQTFNLWRASRVAAEAQAQTERNTLYQVVLNVRTAYFSARAQKALIQVQRDNLANQQRHLVQVQGYVQVGGRPAIDLAQARTNVANAQVQLITAENNYAVARAQLNQAMGVEGPTDYDVEDVDLPPVQGEDLGIDPLLADALKDRPDVQALEKQIRAQKITVLADRGGYGPTLGASTGVTEAGSDISNLVGNWNATVSLNWNLFDGLYRHSVIKEAQANLLSLEAQRDGLRQQVRVDVDQARLSVKAAKATLAAASEALENAQILLRLAEGRYAAGVGNIIELGDAQAALTAAQGQKVQADYNLATARAQLLKALSRP